MATFTIKEKRMCEIKTDASFILSTTIPEKPKKIKAMINDATVTAAIKNDRIILICFLSNPLDVPIIKGKANRGDFI
jgi:hypothetical protein